MNWLDNATAYYYNDISNGNVYNIGMAVIRNPFGNSWDWYATTKFVGQDHAAFHEWGNVPTLDEGKQAAVDAINRFNASLIA